MRLIDADELLKRIKEEGINQAEQCGRNHDPVVMAYGDCYGIVNTAPTIFPKSGEWTEMRNLYGELEGWIHGECGFSDTCAFNYCPSCGAKMDMKEKL